MEAKSLASEVFGWVMDLIFLAYAAVARSWKEHEVVWAWSLITLLYVFFCSLVVVADQAGAPLLPQPEIVSGRPRVSWEGGQPVAPKSEQTDVESEGGVDFVVWTWAVLALLWLLQLSGCVRGWLCPFLSEDVTVVS